MGTRRERVILELDDNLTPGLARAAVAAKGLDRELNRASGSSGKADSSINQLTGRLRLATDAALLLGPALVPIGAVGFAGLVGLTNQLGLAAIAGGTAMVAFQGVGDALGAINEARLDPTIKNVEKVNEAMSRLGPDAQGIAVQLGGFAAAWTEVRDSTAAALFPEVVKNFDDLYDVLPPVEHLLTNVAGVLGEVAANGIESLGSDRWAGIFDSLATDAPQQLGLLASTIGDLAHGLGELWTAFGPLNTSFSGWLADVADSFDSWAGGLEGSEGLNRFFAYLREVGPQVAESMGALGGALVDLGLALAPLGGASLQLIESFADALSALADSDAGTALLGIAAGLSAVNRVMSIAGVKGGSGYFGPLTTGADKARTSVRSLQSDVATMWGGRGAGSAPAAGFIGPLTEMESKARAATQATDRLRESFGKAGRAVGPLAGMGVAMSDLGDDAGFANTATFALMGSFAGLPGVVGGAAVGALLDAAAANNDVAKAAEAASGAVAALPANFASANEAIFNSGQVLESFRESLNPEGFNNPLAGGDFLDLASTKNTIEGIFGKSDVEEAEEAHAKATAAFTQSAEAVAEFGKMAGLGDIDTSNLFELQRAADTLGPAFSAAGTDFKTFLDMFNDPRTRPEAMEEWRRIAPEVRRSLREMGMSGRGSFEQIAAEAREATDAIRGTASAVDALSGTLDSISGEVNLAEALAGLKDIPKGATFNVNTEKGRGNIESLVNYADAAKTQIETLVDEGKFNRASATAGRTIEQLKQFRNQQPGSAKWIDPIINGLERLDRKVDKQRELKIDNKAARNAVAGADKDLANLHRRKAEPKIDANTGPFDGKKRKVDGGIADTDRKRADPVLDALDRASGILNNVLGLLNGIDGRVASSTVTTTYVTRRVNENTGLGPAGSGVALGGELRGGRATRAASGDMVPKTGLPYADRHLYLLADGEHIVTNKNGEADRNRTALEAANRGAQLAVVGNRSIQIPQAGRGSAPTRAAGLSDRDVARIASAVREGAYAGTSAGAPGAMRRELDAQSRWDRDQGGPR